MDAKQTPRRHAVLVKLNDAEHAGLVRLREQEALPKAQVLRRLLVREIRSGNQPAGLVAV